MNRAGPFEFEQVLFPFCVFAGCHGVASPENIEIWFIYIVGSRVREI